MKITRSTGAAIVTANMKLDQCLWVPSKNGGAWGMHP